MSRGPAPAFALLVLAAACGGKATTDGEQGDGVPAGGTSGDGGRGDNSSGGDETGGTSGNGGTGGNPGGIGGWPGEDLSPEEIAFREYLMSDNEGAYFTEEKARTRCEVCAEVIAECAPRRQCVGGYCYPNDEGELECTCSEGAYCLDAIDNPEWPNCPPR